MSTPLRQMKDESDLDYKIESGTNILEYCAK